MLYENMFSPESYAVEKSLKNNAQNDYEKINTTMIYRGGVQTERVIY